MGVVIGEEFDEAGDFRVHLCPAQLAVVGLLACRRLHQRGAGEGGEAAFLHADHIVGHADHVGPAGGGGAMEAGDCRDARR